jgi:hypothetical protein
VLAHLTEDSADIEVDVAGIRYLEAFFDRVVAEVQVVIFDFEGLFEVGQRRPEFLSATEDTRKVVVSDGSVAVAFLSEHLGLAEKFQSHVEVF